MSSTTLNRTLAAGIAAVLLSGAAVGLVTAQGAPTMPMPMPSQTQQAGSQMHQRYLDALAKRLGITTDQLQQAMAGARSDVGMPARGTGAPAGGARSRNGRGAAIGAAAQAIGVTPQQLWTELPGKSLAQVAQAHGKNPADVAAALKTAANQRIDRQVTAGNLTADQATQRKTSIDQRIDQVINQAVPQGQTGPRGPRSVTPVPST
jgi:hypothetical protein